MSLQKLIAQRLAATDLPTICAQLGYSSTDKASKRIEEIISSPVLCLDKSGFDFHYGTPEFIRKLCSLLKIPTLLSNQVIDEIHASLATTKARFIPRLFIETNFKRRNEPIFSLAAMENRRYIAIDSIIQDLPLNDQIDEVQKLIAIHYATQPSLPLWGEVQQYVYFYDAKTIIIFSPTCEIIDVVNEYSFSKTTLSIFPS